ncbi:hypothetical protein A0H81_11303 [Grifola frondosa]|uniref:Uncharacterized protein n=1 Tax=Grifola frondosa TaxID=5627 RepID=A0A1C7LX94_GRIFR|nr:hypothetical protein A0H81_11303 [Grifola frondosa]
MEVSAAKRPWPFGPSSHGDVKINLASLTHDNEDNTRRCNPDDHIIPHKEGEEIIYIEQEIFVHRNSFENFWDA